MLARSVFFCVFNTEKCCVEIEFKACFRNSLRYGLYSSCWRDKLSEAGEFYLHYLARMQSICLAVFVRQRLSYRASFWALRGIRRLGRVMRIIPYSSRAVGTNTVRVASASWCCVLCPRRVVLRFGVLRVALYVVWHSHLKFYVRRLASHLASSFEILREAPCALFDAFVRHPWLKCFVSAIELGSLASALTYAPLCVFCRASVTQRPMRAVKF